MPVQTSYPGVYVQEVPSGVRTIVGVGTSVAVFIGRTKQGPINEPVLCLNLTDFERNFSVEYAGSEMVRALRLFFLNGGTQCYVVRVANGAIEAQVNLKNEAAIPVDVLEVKAKSPGVLGDSIRLAVSYNTLQPEATFNLEVFRWVANGAGQVVKTDVENWLALSMDPASGRYAPTYVSQGSNLVNLTALAGAVAAATGYSQSGRPLRPAAADFRTDLGSALGPNRTLRMSVNGGAPIQVDLSSINLGVPPLSTATPAVIATAIQDAINAFLPASSAIAVSLEAGPGTSRLLRISSPTGDVRIESAATDDLARTLMLGPAQGGLEVSRYANARPAPTGIVFKPAQLGAFGNQLQTAFQIVSINTTNIDLTNTLLTGPAGARMFQDGITPSVTGNNDGVREKWGLIAKALNTRKAIDPTFRWTAQVWGSRLALVPEEGGDNSQGTISTSGGVGGIDIGNFFTPNVRYYSLGTSGTGTFQSGGVAGLDGAAPTLADYAAAYLALDKKVDLFNLLLLPRDADHVPATIESLWGPASVFCQQRRAFLLMDPPEVWTDVQKATDPTLGVNSLRIGLAKSYSAIFYPRVVIKENGLNVKVGPSGAIAGLMGRTDNNRGVWKAPAGTEADIRGVIGLEHRFSDSENGVLNPRAINTLRIFPNGIVNWGARTMDGDDDFASEWKYIPVRRTALFIEESLYRGLKWVVFEPNDEPLWAQIRLNVGAFMHNLFRQGAFQGQKKSDAYFVKCDAETTTQNDINLGIVNVWVGFAPLKPAEFVILYLQQMTGQIQV